MKRFILLINSILLATYVFSTDISKIKFDYLTVDDGLSQGIVETLFQDSQGFIWIGTRDGLNRYDGRNFLIFRNDREDQNSLANNWVSAIIEDNDGKIWIGSGTGLNIYDPVKNTMKRVPTDQYKETAFHGGKVYDIKMDFDKTLWIATTSGIVHYFPQKNIYITYQHDAKNPKSIGNNIVYKIILSKENKLYFTAAADPIYEYDRKNDNFIPHSFSDKPLGSNYMKFIEEDDKGQLWIASENSPLYIYDPRSGTSKFLSNKEGELNANTIKCILFNHPDEVWIGTDGGGIDIYNPQTGVMKYMVSDSRVANSLGGNTVYTILKDKDQNIWIGHYSNAISVWKRNKEKFISYHNNPFNPTTINKEVVAAIFQDSKGRIWIGQDGGGLNLFDENTQTFEHIRHDEKDPTSITSDVILAIQETPSGNLLLGTWNGGFMVFNPDTRKLVKAFYTEITAVPASINVWNILPDGMGNYWLAVLGSGITEYNPSSESFKLYPGVGSNPIVPTNIPMTLTLDKNGFIWCGSENIGIFEFDPSKGKVVKTYRHDDNNLNSLSSNDVKCIVFQDKYAWAATNGGGLDRIDLQTDSVKVYTIKNGLSSNALMGILVDNEKNFWISSTRGLMKFFPATGQVLIFDKSQGIQGNEFKYNSQFRLKDGRMMFGGVNGLTVFNPDSIRDSKIKPNVVFTDFKIFNISQVPGAKKSPLQKSIDFTSSIRLKYKQSVFTFEFASLDYNAPSKNKYKYKMVGFDNDWVEVGNRNFVTYTNLSPGRYTFMLEGSNSDGVFNDNPRIIKIRIQPPWYRTTLAIILFILGLITLIYLYIKQREKQAIHDKMVLQQKIESAQEELDGKVSELDRQKEELRRRDEEEKELRFHTTGVTTFSDIIALKRKNLEELATNIISELVRYVGASAGAIYITDDSDPEHIVLRATGEFCFDSDNEKKYSFEVGEGYIGTCFVEKRTIHVDNLPESYIVLRSGLGETSLRHAFFIPVIQDNNCLGVIEIASTADLPAYKVSFIEKIAETFASVVTIIRANEKTSEMLEQNRMQSEELMAQEEEMRQNLEELQATQEMTQRREKELTMQLEEKNKQLQTIKDEIRKQKGSSKKGS